MWDVLRGLMVKGSFILFKGSGGGARGNVHVEKEDNGFSASFEPGRKMHSSPPKFSLGTPFLRSTE